MRRPSATPNPMNATSRWPASHQQVGQASGRPPPGRSLTTAGIALKHPCQFRQAPVQLRPGQGRRSLLPRSLSAFQSGGLWWFTLLVAATLRVTCSGCQLTLNCPTNDIVVQGLPGSGANVTFTVTATNECDTNVTITCRPASGGL